MYYIFVVNDFEFGTINLKGDEIRDTLLKNKVWLFNSNTPNVKRIKPGDSVIVYTAGSKRQYFNASFEIAGQISDNNLQAYNDAENQIYSMFGLYCSLKEIKLWKRQVSPKPLLEKLEFVKNKKYWGLNFRQSTKVIPQSDYDLIIKNSKTEAL